MPRAKVLFEEVWVLNQYLKASDLEQWHFDNCSTYSVVYLVTMVMVVVMIVLTTSLWMGPLSPISIVPYFL